MKHLALDELVRVKQVGLMLSAYHKTTGCVSALFDGDGKVVAAAGVDCAVVHLLYPATGPSEEMRTVCRHDFPIVAAGHLLGKVSTFYRDPGHAPHAGEDVAISPHLLHRIPVLGCEETAVHHAYLESFAHMVSDMASRVAQEVQQREDAQAAARAHQVAEGSPCEHCRVAEQRRRATDALRESERRLQATIQASAVPIFVIGKDRKVTHWNRALEKLTGTSRADYIGTDRAWAAFHDKERPLLADLLATGRGHLIPRYYHGIYTKSKLVDEAYEAIYFSDKLPGGGKWLHFTAATLRDTKGQLIGAMETIQDITERKVAEEKWHSLYDNLPGGSYTVDDRCVIEDVNDVLCAVTGYTREELVGKPCSLLCGNCVDDCDFRRSGEVFNKEMVLKGKDGRHITVIKSARRIRTGNGEILVENFQDITAQKNLEEQLRHAQKMDAVGQLAGGIAHDFNNLLTVIMGNASLLQMEPQAEEDPRSKHVDHIIKAAEKASQLTRNLLAFSRKHAVQLVSGSVNDILKKAETLLARLIPADIKLEFVPARDYQVKADSIQMEQVIMNLVTNARDAMPSGGTIRIATAEVDLHDEGLGLSGPIPEGKYVRISVTDNGSGMREEVQQRAFEPFFTTKETGKGTGLGLSMVYAIVKQHEGFVRVQSAEGEGTAVQLYLPSTAPAGRSEEAGGSATSPRGSEVVLLAEDEPMVRELMKTMLQEFGYQVLEARDGVEAVELFSAHGEGIDLLLFDVIMPRKNGKAAYDEIRRIRPDMKALFMSGYTGDFLSRKGALEENLNLISKPLNQTRLLQKVRAVLDQDFCVAA